MHRHMETGTLGGGGAAAGLHTALGIAPACAPGRRSRRSPQPAAGTGGAGLGFTPRECEFGHAGGFLGGKGGFWSLLPGPICAPATGEAHVSSEVREQISSSKCCQARDGSLEPINTHMQTCTLHLRHESPTSRVSSRRSCTSQAVRWPPAGGWRQTPAGRTPRRRCQGGRMPRWRRWRRRGSEARRRGRDVGKGPVRAERLRPNPQCWTSRFSGCQSVSQASLGPVLQRDTPPI